MAWRPRIAPSGRGWAVDAKQGRLNTHAERRLQHDLRCQIETVKQRRLAQNVGERASQYRGQVASSIAGSG